MRYLVNIVLGLIVLVLVGCRPVAEPVTPSATVAMVVGRPSATPRPSRTATVELPTAVPATATMRPTETAVPVVFEPPDLGYLQVAIEAELAGFEGLSSYVVVDLESGQRIEREADLAIAGMSLVKIPILVETYRVLDGPPSAAQTRLITETASLSSNYGANLLLELIARQPDAFAGAQVLTESLRQLGLFNTFIAVPYDELARPGYLSSYLTPANQRTDLTTYPDPNMQTTTGDLAGLLAMVYECAEEGDGRLGEVYGEELSQTECGEIFEVMKLNRIGEFIEAGVPAEALAGVAHKHGWIGDTHGDAGVVFSAGGDYVLVIALHQPEWLEWETSAPLIAEISRLVYAHFNDPGAYTEAELAAGLEVVATPEGEPVRTGVVFGTQGIGVTLRSAPGGGEIVVLPEGTVVELVSEEVVEVNGFDWWQVRTGDGREGWVVADYLEVEG